MPEIINLRMARKRKAREEKSKKADANRILHGLSTGIRKQAARENELIKARLESNKRAPNS